MKLIDKITRVVIAIAVAMLILSMFCRYALLLSMFLLQNTKIGS